jgi:hypothetical protein
VGGGLDLRGVLAAGEPLSSGGSSFARPILCGDWLPVLRRLLIGETRRDFSQRVWKLIWPVWKAMLLVKGARQDRQVINRKLRPVLKTPDARGGCSSTLRAFKRANAAANGDGASCLIPNSAKENGKHALPRARLGVASDILFPRLGVSIWDNLCAGDFCATFKVLRRRCMLLGTKPASGFNFRIRADGVIICPKWRKTVKVPAETADKPANNDKSQRTIWARI